MIQQNLINISGQTYRRGDQIGSGGYAVIYKGENIQTQEKVAIRVANDMTEDEYNIHQILIQQKKKFLIDIKGLEHNGNNGTIVIVMELGEEDFHSFMEKKEFKQFTNSDKNLVFYQIVQAVLELHELKYFHRDLKTENFIKIKNSNNDHPNIKLIDFGLCKHFQNQNKLTQQAGTILFMAPEIFSSDQYDETSDIWSLGCIYFEIMTTKTFLEGTTYQRLADQLQNIQQYQINHKIDQQVQMNIDEKNLLKGMLQKQPSLRLTLKEILQQLNNLTKINFYPIQQGNPFIQFPQNQIQPQSFLQWSTVKQQQQQEARLKTQIKTDIDQKYQKQLQDEIAQLKIAIKEQEQQQILNMQNELYQKNQQKQNQLEEELKRQYNLKTQEFLQDKEKLKELYIEHEVETQNKLNQLKQQQEKELKENLDLFQKQIQEYYDKQLEIIIKQKEIQIKAQIETELEQIFLKKLKEQKDKQIQDENQQKKLQFETKKQSIMNLIACYIEALSKNQKIIIEKQKTLTQLDQLNQIQSSQIRSIVNGILKYYEQSLLKVEEEKKLLQNINDINQLNQLEIEYQEKITQQTTNLLKYIEQIDQEIQNLNQFNQQQMERKQNKDKELEQEQKRLSELKTSLDQKLSCLQNQLIQIKQLANVLLHGSQEYEAVLINQRSKKEIESLNQLEYQLMLIRNEFVQIKDLNLFKYKENLQKLFSQCNEIEKLFRKQQEILGTVNQDFIRYEQIELEQLDNRLNEVEDQFYLNKKKFEPLRLEFQNLKLKEIDDCESKLYEIQNLIKRIYFQKQQLCIKKQKQTFNLIEQKYEEFKIQYETIVKLADKQREANQCKQQSNDIMKKLLDQKENLEFQITNFQQQSQKFKFNQVIQLQILQQFNILSDYFHYYVQKCKNFQNISDETTKYYQLNELKQCLNEQNQFYEESRQKFKFLIDQVQQNFLTIEFSRTLKNEKWPQYNDLCQKVQLFQQKLKECRFSKDITQCEYLCQIQKYQDLLKKYDKHFDKCQSDYLRNEKIGKELKAQLELNQDQFKSAKELNLKQISFIKNSTDQCFLKLSKFLQNIFNVHKEQIKFIEDSGFYEQIYKSFQRYQQMQQQVDFINSEIQNYYQREDQLDNNNFYNDKIKQINNHINQIDIQQSLIIFDQVKFQKDKKCFIRLVFFIIVAQFQILIEIIERQLRHQKQLEKKQNENKSLQRQQTNDQKLSEFEIQKIQYENNQIKFQEYLNLNELQISDEYLKIVKENDEKIEKQFQEMLVKDKAKFRGLIKDQELIKKVLEYNQDLEYSQFIQSNEIMILMS